MLILGGETIKSISQQSGARIELQRNPPPNADPNMPIIHVVALIPEVMGPLEDN